MACLLTSKALQAAAPDFTLISLWHLFLRVGCHLASLLVAWQSDKHNKALCSMMMSSSMHLSTMTSTARTVHILPQLLASQPCFHLVASSMFLCLRWHGGITLLLLR